MRYFTDGAGHVVRVDTDATLGDPQFGIAEAAVFSAKTDDWKPSVSIMDKLLFSGDWFSCSEAEALELVAAAGRRRAVLSNATMKVD
ncbi:MAG: hypothetical protein WBO08_11380 [Mycobacterium sp.]